MIDFVKYLNSEDWNSFSKLDCFILFTYSSKYYINTPIPTVSEHTELLIYNGQLDLSKEPCR